MDRKPRTTDQIKQLVADIKKVREEVNSLPTGSVSRLKRILLEDAAQDLAEHIMTLDPVRYPKSVFDPADSEFFGAFAAIALLGQDLHPLKSIAADRIYGTGVYALYYYGDYEYYAPIRGTETPIYVGKADPPSGARTPRQQGTGLTERLNKHQSNIALAESLSVEDFQCRRLVVASGWQIAAENALIGLFSPIWNKQTTILQGFGKHGDDPKTRANKRSPWDTLHPGRKWAADPEQEDAKTIERIREDITQHYKIYPPFTDAHAIIQQLISKVGVDSF